MPVGAAQTGLTEDGRSENFWVFNNVMWRLSCLVGVWENCFDLLYPEHCVWLSSPEVLNKTMLKLHSLVVLQ